MESLFCCPLCSAPLERTETGLLCPNRHSFDRSAAGYVHLLPPNRKHSKNPGDDKEMVAARSAFLDKGYYAPLRDALCEMAADCLKNEPAPVVVDSGCGEEVTIYSRTGDWYVISYRNATGYVYADYVEEL